MTNKKRIEHSVACFVRGDIEAVLALMAEEVEFRPSGSVDFLPWARPRRGRHEVAQYFADLLEVVDYESFEPEKFLADRNEVVVLGQARMRIKTTDRSFDTDWVLRFELEKGKIVRYRDAWDTGAAIEALGLTKPATSPPPTARPPSSDAGPDCR